MKDFLAQFTDSELINLIVGLGKDYNQPIFGVPSGESAASKEKVIDLNRLGIPTITLSDGPAGIGNIGPNTAFPVATLVDCTWNEELAGELSLAIGREADLDKYMISGMLHYNIFPLSCRLVDLTHGLVMN